MSGSDGDRGSDRGDGNDIDVASTCRSHIDSDDHSDCDNVLV